MEDKDKIIERLEEEVDALRADNQRLADRLVEMTNERDEYEERAHDYEERAYDLEEQCEAMRHELEVAQATLNVLQQEPL